MDVWNPMVSDFRDPNFNSYDRGPGKALPKKTDRSTKEPVTLYVTGIPNSVEEEGLRLMFFKAGEVTRVKKLQPRPGKDDTVGFVTMGSVKDAESGIRLFDKFRIQNFTLHVKVALTEEEKRKKEMERLEQEEFLSKLSSFSDKRTSAASASDSEEDGKTSMRSMMGGINGNKQASPRPRSSGRASALKELTGLYEGPLLRGLLSSWKQRSRTLPEAPSGDISMEDPSIISVGSPNSKASGPKKTSPNTSYSVEDLTITVQNSDSHRLSVQTKANENLTLNRLNRQNDGPGPQQGGRGYGRGQGNRGRGMRRFDPGFHDRGNMGRGFPMDYNNHRYGPPAPFYDRGYHGYHRMPGPGYMGRGGPMFNPPMGGMNYAGDAPMWNRPPLLQAPPMYPMPSPYPSTYQQEPYLLQPVILQPSKPDSTVSAEKRRSRRQGKSKPHYLEPELCTACGVEGNMRCSNCKAPYCSEECQREDWPKHRSLCKQIKASNEDADRFEERFDMTVGEELIEGVKGIVEKYTGSKLNVTKKSQEFRPRRGSLEAVDSTSDRRRSSKRDRLRDGSQTDVEEIDVKERSLMPGSYRTKNANSSSTSTKISKPRAESTPERPEVADTKATGSVKVKTVSDKPVSRKVPAKLKLPLNQPGIKVVVTEVASPNDVWVQKFCAEEIQQLGVVMETLEKLYTNSQPELTLANVVMGEFYAAQFSRDDIWYRVRTEYLHPPNNVTVTFVDFGNKENTPVSRLRRLDHSMLDCPLQAINCKLGGIVPPGNQSQWKISAAQLQTHVKVNEEYSVLAEREDHGKVLVQLIDNNGCNVAEKLVKAGLAVFEDMKNTKPEKSVPLLVKDAGCQGEKFQPGAQIEVIIVNATSPTDFTVQVNDVDNMKAFSAFTIGLNQVFNKSEATSYRPQMKGELVVARFSQDNQWYRAEALQVSDRTADLSYIDYGNGEAASFDAIRKATAACLTVPKQAVKCTLWEIPARGHEGWPQDVLVAFAKLTSLESQTPLKAVVKSYVNEVACLDLASPETGESISKALKVRISRIEKPTIDQKSPNTPSKNRQEKPAAKPAPVPPPPQDDVDKSTNSSKKEKTVLVVESLPVDGSLVDVELAHFNSLTDFYVQLVKGKETLTLLMQRINQQCAANTTPHKPEVGELVCAQYHADNIWYRARVNQITSDGKYAVTYVDYGNSDTVAVEAIRKLDSTQDKCQAVHCGLAGVTDPDQKKLETFVACVSATALQVKATGCVDGCYQVQLYTEDNIWVNEKLGCATKSPAQMVSTPAAETTKPSTKSVGKSVTLPLDGTWQDGIIFVVVGLDSFFMQLLEDKSLLDFAVLMEDIANYYKSEGSPYRPEMGELVCAQSAEDQLWYRAQVMRAVEESVYVVFFVDYGNSEMVEGASIRQLIPRFRAHPHMAIHCSLAGCAAFVESEDKLKQFRVRVNLKLQVKAMKRDGDVYVVELQENGVSVNEKLGLVATPPSPAVATASVKQQPTKQTPAVAPLPVADSTTVMAAAIPVASFPTDARVVEGQITDISGLDSFYMQCREPALLEKFEAMRTALGLHCSTDKTPYKPAVVGELVSALYSADSSWYRARVDRIFDDKFAVFFIDYGNKDLVDLQSIRRLDARFTNEPQMAIQCRLAGMTVKQDAAKLREFANHCNEQMIFKTRLIQTVSSIQEVQLFTADDTCVNTALGFRVPAATSSPVSKPQTSVAKSPQSASAAVAVVPPSVMPLPCDGRQVEAKLSHINGLDSFFLQLNEKSSQEKLEALMVALNQKCTACNIEHKPKQGEFVCAMFSQDNTWYRARCDGVDDAGFLVTFLDYGNSEQVPASRIRKYTDLNDVSLLLEVQLMAIPCKLQGFTGDPADKLLEFASLIQKSGANMLFIAKGVKFEKDMYEVQLYLDGACVNTELGFLAPNTAASPVSKPQTSVAKSTPSASAAVTAMPPSVMPLPCDGSQVETKLSHINGLDSFYLQLNEKWSQEKLEALMVALNQKCTACNIEHKPRQGEFVCAMFSQDNTWYRARCDGVDDAGFLVTFLDYGNSEQVPASRIRKYADLNDVSLLLEVQLMAIPCKLQGLTGDPADKLLEFASWIQKSGASMLFIAKGVKFEKDMYEVQLYLDGACVNTELGFLAPNTASAPISKPQTSVAKSTPSASAAVTAMPPSVMPLPCDGSQVETKLSHVNGLDSFCLQLNEKSSQEKLEALMVALNQKCTACNIEHKPKQGEFVCAMFSQDNTWYRARCDAVDDAGFLVTFLDYGNSEQVPASRIRKYTDLNDVSLLLEVPLMAIPCKLQGLTGDPMDKLPDFVTLLQKVGTSMLFMTKAVKFENDMYEVQLYLDDGMCVNTELGFSIGSTTPRKRESTEIVDQLPKPVSPSAEPLPRWKMSPSASDGNRKVIFLQTMQQATPEDKEFCAVMTSVVNPGKFHCHIPTKDGTDKLALMSHSMSLEGDSELDLPSFDIMYQVGELCCAKYAGVEWCRAAITQVFPDQTAEVQFVDFGNQEILPLRFIRPIRDEYIELPILAFECSLAGVKPVGSSWCSESIKKMKTFENKLLTAHRVNIKENNVFELELIWKDDGTNVNLAENLISNGLARDASSAANSPTASGAQKPVEELSEEEKLRQQNLQLMQQMEEMKAMMLELQKKK